MFKKPDSVCSKCFFVVKIASEVSFCTEKKQPAASALKKDRCSVTSKQNKMFRKTRLCLFQMFLCCEKNSVINTSRTNNQFFLSKISHLFALSSELRKTLVQKQYNKLRILEDTFQHEEKREEEYFKTVRSLLENNNISYKLNSVVDNLA